MDTGAKAVSVNSLPSIQLVQIISVSLEMMIHYIEPPDILKGS